MNRLAVKVGENMLAALCLLVVLEAVNWGALGIQAWRDRR